MRNIPEHADTDKMWICGQYWPSDDLVKIAIIDEGIGICRSMIKNKAHRECIKTRLSAIEMALKADISESFFPSSKQKRNDDIWANSGFGLYTVSEICKKLGGNFCIISYGNYVFVDAENTQIGITSFSGNL